VVPLLVPPAANLLSYSFAPPKKPCQGAIFVRNILSFPDRPLGMLRTPLIVESLLPLLRNVEFALTVGSSRVVNGFAGIQFGRRSSLVNTSSLGGPRADATSGPKHKRTGISHFSSGMPVASPRAFWSRKSSCAKSFVGQWRPVVDFEHGVNRAIINCVRRWVIQPQPQYIL